MPNQEPIDAARLLEGIFCSHDGCLASVQWFGHPTDPALGMLARDKGWCVLEGGGWVCPRHLQVVLSSASLRARAAMIPDHDEGEGR